MYYCLFFFAIYHCHPSFCHLSSLRRDAAGCGCFEMLRYAYEIYSQHSFVSWDQPAADIVCSASSREPPWDCRGQLLHCASPRQHI